MLAPSASPSVGSPKTPTISRNQKSVDSEGFQTPPAISTPLSGRMLDLNTPCNDSSLYLTPPRQLLKDPVVMPSRPVQDMPNVHPELRAHNRPGLKEAPVDVSAPRMTRSGKTLGM